MKKSGGKYQSLRARYGAYSASLRSRANGEEQNEEEHLARAARGRGRVNLLTPTGGHETGNFQRFLFEDPDINSDAQRARLSDNKTADNFVEFMSRVLKRGAKENHS